MSARNEILGAVRRALGGAAGGLKLANPTVRTISPSRQLNRDEVIARFTERVLEYGTDVRMSTTNKVASVLTDICSAYGMITIAVPQDWPKIWMPHGVQVRKDTGLKPRELDTFDGALTGCRLAIAETGTIVFDGGPRQGKRILTLLPELLICVLVRSDIVESIVDAFDALATGPAAGRVGALTFVSGPSATTDIEFIRVQGVHGPRRMVVILTEAQDH